MAIDLQKLFASFLQSYDAEKRNAIWAAQSQKFRKFWADRILGGSKGELNDSEVDEIVRILDRHGKGNTKDSEAVARVMTPQGAWRRMFKEIKATKPLARALNDVFTETDLEKRAAAINKLYELNQGHRNNLTGQSGNTINAMLAAWDPFKNSSIASLNDRKKIIEYFEFEGGPDFATDTIGQKITQSDRAIASAFNNLGIHTDLRTITKFLYSPELKPVWRQEAEDEDAPVSETTKRPSLAAGEETPDPALFYMESQLEDFLIENWDKTELGKRYDLIEEDGELKSQQYKTDIGIIDILAQDKTSKQLVVIELKKDQTSDDTVGQLTRYMGWLEEHKTSGQPTKGIIIAARYDNRLHYALKKVPGVEVYLYRVDFKLQEFAKPKN